ncbi:Rhodanese domain protein [Magnetococcus marinus MC-1]|uniref:Rhodanese domain protein n=2 Tax=Magnetococcus TaxID=162171 RepID=A0L7V9_MAGMM|nr:Rhodanese domain protein [Magnetococcus marinus MC-1]
MALCVALTALTAIAGDGEEGGAGNTAPLEVNITRTVGSFEVKHGRGMVQVIRNQDPNGVIDEGFDKTSRKCPPFCAVPMTVADGVRTIGEVELMEFMTTHLADGSGVLVDARSPDWHAKGTIPGSINVPYIEVSPQLGADELSIEAALSHFGVVDKDFSKAKYLVLWCNGPWCGQSPTAIRGLIELGYPKEKLLYYRGGMQLWKIFGLPVVPPAAE